VGLSYCSACGHPAGRGAKKCERCGRVVVTSPPGNAAAVGCATVVILVPVALMVTCFVMSPGPSSSSSERPAYTHEQRESAKQIMDMVKAGMAIVEVEGPHLVVHFTTSGYPADDASRLGLIRTIADADAVLRGGSSRNIYFYDPSGRQMGQADPLDGIRLTH
jgi:hypothetical protein